MIDARTIPCRPGHRFDWLASLALAWTAALTGLASAQVPLTQQGPMRQQYSPAPSAAWRSEVKADPATVAAGRRLYAQGVLPSGGLLTARRHGQELTGEAAACVQCHRPSGLGSVEGTVQISPVTGRYLFDQDRRAVVQMHLRTIKSFNERHAPYTAESLAAALRDGRHISGRPLDTLMPRYTLGDADLAVLATYLRQLSSDWSPGVTDKRLRLATVITPDVEPARRQVFLDTVQAAVAQKNSNFVPGQRSMSSAAEMVLGTERYWDFEVWQLDGPPDQWPAQLARRYAANPVFALVSGLGQGVWAPVHQFCEAQALPCWFPSVEAPPPESDDDRYSVYFSRGIALEAATLAQHLLSAPNRPAQVLQWATDDATGRTAAQALGHALQEAGIASTTHYLDPASSAAPPPASANDTVVAWLRPAQIERLGAQPPPPGAVYFSGQLSRGRTDVFPVAWRTRLHLVYPYQLPARRQAGMTYFRQWLQVRQLPLTDEVLQAEVYFAIDYLNDTLVEMLDNLHRDYLLERAESLLSLREASRAEDAARELMLVRPQAGAVDRVQGSRPMAQRDYLPRPLPGRMELAPARKESTTVYPRLSLGPGQRIASKGAQLLRFSADLQTLVPETPWMIAQVP
jgi:mono/diheme cytochrome c family protein